jgi:hypothetical protein
MKTLRSVRAALSSAAPHATRSASAASRAHAPLPRSAVAAAALLSRRNWSQRWERHWRPVIFVALARMYRGEHHPTGIPGSLVFSALWLAATFVLIKPNADGSAGRELDEAEEAGVNPFDHVLEAIEVGGLDDVSIGVHGVAALDVIGVA